MLYRYIWVNIITGSLLFMLEGIFPIGMKELIFLIEFFCYILLKEGSVPISVQLPKQFHLLS